MSGSRSPSAIVLSVVLWYGCAVLCACGAREIGEISVEAQEQFKGVGEAGATVVGDLREAGATVADRLRQVGATVAAEYAEGRAERQTEVAMEKQAPQEPEDSGVCGGLALVGILPVGLFAAARYQRAASRRRLPPRGADGPGGR